MGLTDGRRQAALLVVDDDKTFGRSIVGLLQHRYDVTVELSGERGARIGESEAEFDLVMLDLYIPDVTGAEIYERWRQTAPARLRRLVFASAGADHPVIAPWISKTGIEVLHKPFDPKKLMDLIDRFASLPYSRGPREPVRPPALPRPATPRREILGAGPSLRLGGVIDSNDVPPAPAPRASKPKFLGINLDFDDGDEPDTGVIDLAIAQGAPPEVIAELRIRRLHKSQSILATDVAAVKNDVADVKSDLSDVKADVGAVKTDVSSIKTSVDDLKTYRAKADASVKTVMIVCSVLVVVTGGVYELLKTFVFHAY